MGADGRPQLGPAWTQHTPWSEHAKPAKKNIHDRVRVSRFEWTTMSQRAIQHPVGILRFQVRFQDCLAVVLARAKCDSRPMLPTRKVMVVVKLTKRIPGRSWLMLLIVFSMGCLGTTSNYPTPTAEGIDPADVFDPTASEPATERVLIEGLNRVGDLVKTSYKPKTMPSKRSVLAALRRRFLWCLLRRASRRLDRHRNSTEVRRCHGR